MGQYHLISQGGGRVSTKVSRDFLGEILDAFGYLCLKTCSKTKVFLMSHYTPGAGGWGYWAILPNDAGGRGV